MTRRPDGTDPADGDLVDEVVENCTRHVRPGATAKTRRTLNALEEADEFRRIQRAKEVLAYERGRRAEREAVGEWVRALSLGAGYEDGLFFERLADGIKEGRHLKTRDEETDDEV